MFPSIHLAGMLQIRNVDHSYGIAGPACRNVSICNSYSAKHVPRVTDQDKRGTVGVANLGRGFFDYPASEVVKKAPSQISYPLEYDKGILVTKKLAG